MLTLSMSWSQASAQNLSSEKEMLTFTLAGQTGSSIDQTARTITVIFPYGTVVTAKIATFTSSEFSNVYVGASPTGTLAVSGTSPATNYALGDVVWTVEAENHSYDNYTVEVDFELPATGKSLLSFQPDYNKDVPGDCHTPDPVLLTGTDVTFTGTAVTYNVEFGADLANVTVNLTVSPLATCSPADFTIVDFSGGPVNFTVTAQDLSTQVYVITAKMGLPSEKDYLESFDVTGGTVAINHVNQTIAVEVPYSTAISGLKPTWAISTYAVMYDAFPLVTEICSGVATVGGMASYNSTLGTASFWIVAEDVSEVSEYVVTFTNADASEENALLGLDVIYSKTWGDDECFSTETGTVTANISTTTVTINLPYGVTSVSIDYSVG